MCFTFLPALWLLLSLLSIKFTSTNGMEDIHSTSKRSVNDHAGVTHSACCHSCPPFWTHFQDNCYRFFGSSTTWADAEVNCNEYFTGTSQGHLVSIHDKEESAFVFKLWHDSLIQSSQLSCTMSAHATLSPFNSIFLGLNDRDQEGVFVWTDGTANDYNEWGLNQPSDWGGNEDCSHWIDPTVDDTTKPWNDLPCSSPLLFPYVCKLRFI